MYHAVISTCVYKHCCLYVWQFIDVAGVVSYFSDRRRCVSKPVHQVRVTVVDFTLFNLQLCCTATTSEHN